MKPAESASEVCVGCGYDLAGRTLGEVCPECGETIVQSPFRGAWRDVQARGRFVLGAGVLVCAGAIDMVRTGGQLGSQILGFDGFRVSGLHPAFVVCQLAAIIVLGLAARRIAVVWLLVIVLAIRVLAEVAMFYGPQTVAWFGQAEVHSWFAIAWAVAITAGSLLAPVLARSAGRPSRRAALWCVCLIGALGSGYFGLTVAAPELLLPVLGLIKPIARVTGGSMLTLSIFLGAACTTLSYLLLAHGIRGAGR
jgi:hypothetical protein